MKYLIIFTFLIGSLIVKHPSSNQDFNESNHSKEHTELSESIRVMTFNIRFDNPNDGPNAWPHRKEFVASTIRFHQTDIVGTQEGMHHQLTELENLLEKFEWVGVGRDDGDEKGEFSAIFYRSDRFDLLEEGTFWHSTTPDVPGSMGWDTAITRVTTWVRLHDKLNDRSFITFNTHYDHIGEVARKESSNLILQKIYDLSNGDPVLFMGDLNTTEQQEPYKIITDPQRGPVELELFDGFYHSVHGHHGPTSTWNGFERIFPDRRIDYIFVDSKFRVVQHGILADSRDGKFPSDHLPVVADLEFKD